MSKKYNLSIKSFSFIDKYKICAIYFFSQVKLVAIFGKHCNHLLTLLIREGYNV